MRMVPPTPRDFLANERTFLAYLRTALSFIAFGFVIARFALFNREVAIVEHLSTSQPAAVSTTLGVAMAVCGIALGIYGAIRYIQQNHALRHNVDGAMTDRSAIVMAGGILVFGIIITIDLLRLH